MVASTKSNKVKKINLKFNIDCSKPVADKVFDVAAFETYLNQRFKVEGKTSNLAGKVEIRRNGAIITFESTVPFSKAYIKYLAKKFLKKNDLRDFLHVIAHEKGGYQLRYFNLNEDEAATA